MQCRDPAGMVEGPGATAAAGSDCRSKGVLQTAILERRINAALGVGAVPLRAVLTFILRLVEVSRPISLRLARLSSPSCSVPRFAALAMFPGLRLPIARLSAGMPSIDSMPFTRGITSLGLDLCRWQDFDLGQTTETWCSIRVGEGNAHKASVHRMLELQFSPGVGSVLLLPVRRLPALAVG
jgi:hypothetical protein